MLVPFLHWFPLTPPPHLYSGVFVEPQSQALSLYDAIYKLDSIDCRVIDYNTGYPLKSDIQVIKL